jgi:DUF1680 family protein
VLAVVGGILCVCGQAQPPVTDRLVPLEPGTTSVGGEISRSITATIEGNILQLDVDRDFLAPFRSRSQRGGFIGLGMLIDSLVHMARHTGDERVLALKNRTVAEAIAAQQDDGYLGIMPEESRTWRLWDTHESAYLIHGLTSDFLLCGERRSLEAAERIGDRLVERLRSAPDRDLGDGQVSNDTATTGLDLALLRLADCTGKATFREFVIADRRLPAWNLPIVTGRWGRIDGHAYAFMDHALAQAHLDRIDPRLAGRHAGLRRQVDAAVDFLLRRDGLAITGGCGDHECWHDTQQGTTNLAETCATGCVIRLMDDCLRREANGRFGDVMERAIHNALFAAQSPDGRQIRYYTPSRTTVDVEGVAVGIRQDTDYPTSGRVTLAIDPARPVNFPLWLRIPRWCTEATVQVNDGPPALALRDEDGFCSLSRRWQAGDRVTLDLPMRWRFVKGRVAQAGKVAVMRGPRVFCLSRSGVAMAAGTDAPATEAADATLDLRLITIKPESIGAPPSGADGGGMSCRVDGWSPGRWYPFAPPDLRLTLTAFPDPGGMATFFTVPNPAADEFVDDDCREPDGCR